MWFVLAAVMPRMPPHNPKVAGSNSAPATMNDEGLPDATAANPFRLPRLHPGIDSALGGTGVACPVLRRVFACRVSDAAAGGWVVEPPAQLRQDTFGVPVG